MSFTDLIGVLGVVAYLASYFLLQIERLRFDDYHYLFLNVLAAILIIISLLSEFNLSAFLIEVVWVVISVYGLVRRWQNDARSQASARC